MCGKARSGKSTLMKFVSKHPTTARLLEDWRSRYTMLTATFYFWNARSTLQKSQAGLLRSILHDALEKHPKLIPIIFPMHRRLLSRRRTVDREPTLDKLKTAFSKLMKQEVIPMKICMFIDSIDKFEGDHEELKRLLTSVVSHHIKLMVSSRPTPEYYDIFDHFPRFQLHDFTQKDIRQYVKGHLFSQGPGRLMESSRINSSDISNLIDEIMEKASGVFQ